MGSELEAIQGAKSPLTTERLSECFRQLGIREGDVILAHSSLSSCGWIAGGSVALIDALLSCVGKSGTLLMPAQSSDLSEPKNWGAPPVPEIWWQEIRDSMPAFDLHRTPTRGVGRVPEVFRSYPGVVRSPHPSCSFCGLGPSAASILNEHPLDDPFGEESPLGKMLDLRAKVFLFGVYHGSSTMLHLAERRALGEDQERIETGAPLLVDGIRKWVSYRTPDVDADDFPTVGAAYERSDSPHSALAVGTGEVRLIPSGPLVEFATAWFRQNRQ